jgi:hypothetical protein
MEDDSSSESESDSNSKIENKLIDNTLTNNTLIDNTFIENILIDMDTMYPEIVNYKINYTVKQLMQICEYYGISKNMKLTKANKDEIINNIVLFENDPCNYDIVIKRNLMWHYIKELKSDKFMKKFILLWQ